MADYSAIDFFSEIDELCSFVDGKGGNSFDLIDIDERVETNTGIPSHGLVDDDAMLAVDSSNALIMGDPLLNLFDQNDLLERQSASPSHNPETLMPVSLPADSPPRLHATAQTASPPSSPCPAPDSLPAVQTSDKAVAAGTNVSVLEKPVRIVVKTKRNSEDMVVPLPIPQPSHNLVKIPKSDCATRLVRLRTLRAGGKLGPVVTASRIHGQSSTTPIVTRVPVTVGTLSQSSTTPVQEPPAKRFCPSVPSAESSATEELPFRSLRTRNPSESSTSDSSKVPSNVGMKRKAYEMEPLNDPEMERCRRNAINAKRNREQKKAQLAELERTVESVSRERDQLAGENESLREAKSKLEQQVQHLSNILKNQSKLSEVIGKLGMTSVVLGDVTSAEEEVVSSGMCLHVNGEETTIEYCSYCAKKAGKKLSV